MPELPFNPLDPLGIFERRESERRQPRTDARQADINKFLAQVRKNIPDESMASEEYRRMSVEAERLGFHSTSVTLMQMSQDEAHHERNLRDMAITIW